MQCQAVGMLVLLKTESGRRGAGSRGLAVVERSEHKPRRALGQFSRECEASGAALRSPRVGGEMPLRVGRAP